MHQRDRRTDNRQTDTGRQQRPRLRIASRGKDRTFSELSDSSSIVHWCSNDKTQKFVRFYYRARQHAYACRARYCYGKSVRLSVRHTLVLYLNERTYRQTLSAGWRGMIVVFRPLSPLQNSKGNSLSSALRARGGKILQFSTEIAVYIANGTTYRPMVSMDHQEEVIGCRSIRVGSHDLEWSWKVGREGSNFWRISVIPLVRFDPEWPKLAG